jgi:hypothetical protein
MPSSGTLRSVSLVRTEVAEENTASIIRVTRIGDLGTTLAVTSNRTITLVMDDIRSYDTSIRTGAEWRNITEDGIFIVTGMKTSYLT